MERKNKFGFGPIETTPEGRRERSSGPMSVAVREAAEDLQATTDAKIEARKRNAEEAREYRDAVDEGRVLVRVALDVVRTDELPRDRMDLEAVAVSDEMEELKASIRARGQKEPVELYRDGAGRLQLKKGWRRLTALRQLLGETGDAAFGTVLARVETGAAEVLDRYVDMVEENVVREDLSFAEMAQVALTAAGDPAVAEDDPDVLVNRLYGALHKMKRSYIRSFVFLLTELGEDLSHPKAVARNLGVEVARKLQRDGGAGELRAALAGAGDAEAERVVLARFLEPPKPVTPAERRAKEKYEFRVGTMKVTARKGECRIVSGVDFAALPKDRLEKAVKAFEAALEVGE